MFTYTCSYENEEWECTAAVLIQKHDYRIIEIEGKGSKFTVYVGGEELRGNWCFFPENGIAAQLSDYTDAFWNTESLTRAFDNPYDGRTVAQGIFAVYSHFTDVQSYIKSSRKGKSSEIVAVLYDSKSDEYHCITDIRKESDECVFVTLYGKDYKQIEVTAPFISMLNYYYGNCIIIESSPYLGMNYKKLMSK